ncbi:hypothetical protein [Psittacicella gerlachiana]|uniref:Lipoprotein n=1 Tax=Psittacicella gerlachiana TaxID=2028574 RepID=A0A3A1Y4K9_9GAMM|nr:hypothetical protein [Psittacicella gerlachiana]RIY32505.1 hypothetical protein CKF59_06915 [Psittacicella gerlachiana]
MRRFKSLIWALVLGFLVVGCNKEVVTSNDAPENKSNRLTNNIRLHLDENYVVDEYVNLNQEQVDEFYKNIQITPIVTLADIYKDGKLHLSYAIKNIGTQPIEKVFLKAIVNFKINSVGAIDSATDKDQDNSEVDDSSSTESNVDDITEASTQFFLIVPIIFDQSYKLTDVTSYDLNAYSPALTVAQAPNYLLPGQAITITLDYNLHGLDSLFLVPQFIRNSSPQNYIFNGFFTIPRYLETIDSKFIDTRDFPLSNVTEDTEQPTTEQVAPDSGAPVPATGN